MSMAAPRDGRNLGANYFAISHPSITKSSNVEGGKSGFESDSSLPLMMSMNSCRRASSVQRSPGPSGSPKSLSLIDDATSADSCAVLTATVGRLNMCPKL